MNNNNLFLDIDCNILDQGGTRQKKRIFKLKTNTSKFEFDLKSVPNYCSALNTLTEIYVFFFKIFTFFPDLRDCS